MFRELWTCPRCGRRLVVRNQEHACLFHDLEGHFRAKDPIGRAAFDWICDLYRSRGPIDVLSLKTTIAFANGVNVAFLTPMKHRADVSVVLNGTVDHPRIASKTAYSRTKVIHRIPVRGDDELDEELAGWLLEAYDVTLT